MGYDLDGAVLLSRTLLEGLALHPPGDHLWRLVIILVDQALEALKLSLDGRHVGLPPRHLPPRSGARMPIQVPHRPVPAGVLGVADRDRVPQPPIMRPLCQKF